MLARHPGLSGWWALIAGRPAPRATEPDWAALAPAANDPEQLQGNA
jgi:hypothetical protein